MPYLVGILLCVGWATSQTSNYKRFPTIAKQRAWRNKTSCSLRHSEQKRTHLDTLL